MRVVIEEDLEVEPQPANVRQSVSLEKKVRLPCSSIHSMGEEKEEEGWARPTSDGVAKETVKERNDSGKLDPFEECVGVVLLKKFCLFLVRRLLCEVHSRLFLVIEKWAMNFLLEQRTKRVKVTPVVIP